MTEDSLQHLSLDELYDLLVKTVNEYLALHRDSKKIGAIKKGDLKLIQEIITKRKG